MSHSLDPVALRPNSSGLDKALEPLQLALIDNLPWLEFSYGQAVTDVNEPTAPAVYTGGRAGDYLRLTHNDRQGAFSFIDPEGPRIIKQNVPPRRIEAPVAVVIMGNLTRMTAAGTNPYANLAHYPAEELLADVLRAIRGVREFTLTKVGVLRKDVLGRYDEQFYSGLWPEFAFRLSGSIPYIEVC